MGPRYTIDHTYTPTEQEAHIIVNHIPGYPDVLRKFLCLNDPENQEEPPVEFWEELREMIVRGIKDGGMGSRESMAAIQPFQEVAVTSHPVTSEVYFDAEPLSILAQEWMTRLHLPLLNVGHRLPHSATVNLRKFVAYRSSLHPLADMASSSSPTTYMDVLVLDKLISVPGTAQQGQPQFLITHMGPFHRTGFASVVQVMTGISHDSPHIYIGRHSFQLKPAVGEQWKPEVGDRLPQGEWAALPTEIQNNIIASIVGARDDFSKKFCARAYLREIREVVDPTAVRALYERDGNHIERLALYDNIDIVRAILRALNRGQETLYLYSLRYERYDKTFADLI